MAELSKEQGTKREKTLLIAMLLSVPGPIITGMAAISSHSSTQEADFIRRSAELIALFVSWWVFRYLQRHVTLSEDSQTRLERMAGLSVALAMACSGVAMLIIAIPSFFDYEPAGNVIAGLAIAVLGFLTNAWFWRRYAFLTREQFNPVTAAQEKLYRAKASVDLCVLIALTAVSIAPEHPVTQYIDVIGSITVALYLLYSGLDTLNLSIKKASVKYAIEKS